MGLRDLFNRNGTEIKPEELGLHLERADNVDMLLNHDVRCKLASTINALCKETHNSDSKYRFSL